MLRSISLLSLLLLIGCSGLPTNGDSDVRTALDLYKRREFAEAIPHLQNSLDKPIGEYSRSEVLTMIGNCYNELDQFEESLKYHDLSIQEDPENYKAYVNKGIVYRLTGEYAQAGDMYSKALEIEPDYPELHASMGALAIYQEDYSVAIDYLERALELDDTLAVTHSNLALAYATVGRFDEAEKALKEAVVRGYHQPEVIKERIEKFRMINPNN
ncbi:MAG: tetratricopeptide repeat protein [Leptolyngbyaceae cyanobacterium MO_188.B28]|nr:tetratricopeptide repeat protein [Leptolyngbyaceae cyanobacterium MO_188.B28]